MIPWSPILVDQLAIVAIAIDTAKRHSLAPSLVCAVCEEESGKRDSPTGGRESWNQWAIKYEAGFLEKYVKPKDVQHPTTAEIASALSYGLMQIMGLTAREYGFTGKFLTELCEPSTGLEFGCRKLRHCLDVCQNDPTHALLVYNGGADVQYPVRVLARVSKYGSL